MNNVLVFESFPLILAQILRGICIAIAPFCIILSIRLIRKTNMARYRKRIYAGLCFLVTSGLYTQVERFDDPASLRLFIVTPGMILVFTGLWRMRNYMNEDV